MLFQSASHGFNRHPMASVGDPQLRSAIYIAVPISKKSEFGEGGFNFKIVQSIDPGRVPHAFGTKSYPDPARANSNEDRVYERVNAFEDQDDNSQCNMEEGSYDPFGIYETVEKMKEDGRNAKEVNSDVIDDDIRQQNEVCLGNVTRHQPLKAGQTSKQGPVVTVPATVKLSAKESCPAAGPAPSSASIMDYPIHYSNEGKNDECKNTPIGFDGGFVPVSGIVDSEDNLTNAPGFSNCNSLDGCLGNSYNKGSFLSEIQKILEMGKAMGDNLEGCYDRVKDLVEGNGDKMVLR
ncbi:unnamed protein product [Lactuca saligna]|uniref:Uncharacterized protein n=1 Tax=Lactuca saligna TaxID=75948 RepID=A0AA36EKS7_LACSI|nr:unnamed protein product [Lactuca saligna]